MIRSVVALSVPLLAIALAALWLTTAAERLPARFAPEDCRRVAVTAEGGALLVGIEDLARLPDGRLLLSARDRRGDGPGGLFTVSPGALAAPTASATRLPGTKDGLRPQGVAVEADGRLAFIDRRGRDAGDVVWGRIAGGAFREDGRVGGPDFCRANDLGFAGGALFVTLDRESCGTALADLAPWGRTGRVARILTASGSVEIVAEGLSFPNGIHAGVGSTLVAETRAARLAPLGGGEGIALRGGPDNLTATTEGRLVAALHPDLFGLALWRGGLARRAASRIALVDPASGASEILHDDPEGQLYSGATAAVFDGDVLIAGSALDEGLLVCGGPR